MVTHHTKYLYLDQVSLNNTHSNSYVSVFDIADKEEMVNMQSLIRSRPQFCMHCHTVVPQGTGYKKRRASLPAYSNPVSEYTDPDLELIGGAGNEEVIFCSPACYNHFDAAHINSTQEPPPKVR